MRFLLMPKQIPNAEDGTELAVNGVTIVETLFAGAVLVVEGPENLAEMLREDRWTVEADDPVHGV